MPQKSPQNKNDTSWGGVASWYDEYLSNPDSYQEQVVLPNLIRILSLRTGERVLDLACGQGFFSGAMADVGARVEGTDIAKELIEKARARHPRITFGVAPAHLSHTVVKGPYDTIVCVLAIQNIKELSETFETCKKLLVPRGRLIIVLNHPAFRIPQGSDWYFDEKTKKQGRVVNTYLSESSVKIDMHPGAAKKTFTLSFHRPLQVYMKLLSKQGFALTRLEEWISHKKSTAGPRASAEDHARKEIPLFMCIELKLQSVE